MSEQVHIDSWERVQMQDGMSLFGFITGHPDPMVGVGNSASITSVIVEEGDGWVKTKSGTTYILGREADASRIQGMA